MKFKFFFGLLIAAMLSLLTLSQAGATPLDLSTFTAEAGAVVTSGGGGGVTFTESDSPYAWFYVYDPAFFVDPATTTLTFDYLLEIAPENDDYLVVVIDYLDYVFEMGGYNNSPDTPLILSGTATVDLVPFRNATIDLAFGFEANDLYTGSVATISNLEINQTSNTTPIPEPATMLLLGLGLIGLAGLKRKKHL